MTTWGNREALARYINLLAGEKAGHAEIAARINERNPGARVAGPLVSRWRAGKLDVSPGNLAALARAYDRNPLEAFVAAGLLDEDEAARGLDETGQALLDLVRRSIHVELANVEKLDEKVIKLAQRKQSRPAPPEIADEAARHNRGKPKMGDD